MAGAPNTRQTFQQEHPLTFQGPLPKKPAHKRMKPKAGAKPTRDEQRHMDRVASLPCLVSGNRPVTLHHVTGDAHVMGRLASVIAQHDVAIAAIDSIQASIARADALLAHNAALLNQMENG